MSYTTIQKNTLRLHLNSQTFEERVLRYASVFLFVLGCVYAWALVSTVFDTAKRKTFVRENAVISSEIAELEKTSLGSIKELALDKEVNTYGLIPSKKVQYATRITDTKVALR